jgi:hypothetical protein
LCPVPVLISVEMLSTKNIDIPLHCKHTADHAAAGHFIKGIGIPIVNTMLARLLFVAEHAGMS